MAASNSHGNVSVWSPQSSSTSTDSSDDQTEPNEKLQQFQDAAVTAEYIADLCRWKKSSATTQTTKDSQLKSCLPSKRSVDVDEHEDENPLNTTPEFRAFVAKKLAEKLDREIEFCVMEGPASEYASWMNHDSRIEQEGVRLFSDSTQVLSDTEKVLSEPRPAQKRHRHHRALRAASDGSEAERLASVVVTADFLAEERAMWARLRQSSQERSEKQELISTMAGENKDTHGPSQLETVPKKKKKKKKQAKDDGEGTDSGGEDLGAATGRSSHKEKADHDVRKIKRKMEDSWAASNCMSENGADQNVNFGENGECEHEPVKKKKKCKNRELGPSVSNSANPNSSNSGENPKKRKKKRHKAIKNSTDDACGSSLPVHISEEIDSVERARDGERIDCERQVEKKNKLKTAENHTTMFAKYNSLANITSKHTQNKSKKQKKTVI